MGGGGGRVRRGDAVCPNDAELHAARARAGLLGDYEDAVSAFRRALALDPRPGTSTYASASPPGDRANAEADTSRCAPPWRCARDVKARANFALGLGRRAARRGGGRHREALTCVPIITPCIAGSACRSHWQGGTPRPRPRWWKRSASARLRPRTWTSVRCSPSSATIPAAAAYRQGHRAQAGRPGPRGAGRHLLLAQEQWADAAANATRPSGSTGPVARIRSFWTALEAQGQYVALGRPCASSSSASPTTPTHARPVRAAGAARVRDPIQEARRSRTRPRSARRGSSSTCMRSSRPALAVAPPTTRGGLPVVARPFEGSSSPAPSMRRCAGRRGRWPSDGSYPVRSRPGRAPWNSAPSPRPRGSTAGSTLTRLRPGSSDPSADRWDAGPAREPGRDPGAGAAPARDGGALRSTPASRTGVTGTGGPGPRPRSRHSRDAVADSRAIAGRRHAGGGRTTGPVLRLLLSRGYAPRWRPPTAGPGRMTGAEAQSRLAPARPGGRLTATRGYVPRLPRADVERMASREGGERARSLRSARVVDRRGLHPRGRRGEVDRHRPAALRTNTGGVTMAIIAISHQMGAGGTEIGMGARNASATTTGPELIRRGPARSRREKLDPESAHAVRALRRRDAALYHNLTDHPARVRRSTTTRSSWGAAGSGAARHSHVLRIRVIAPFTSASASGSRDRRGGGRDANHRAAADLLRRDDSEKAGRMRYLYEVDVADPSLYDLVVNTEKLRYEAAVEMIERAVRRPEMTTSDAARRIVASRALASRVQVALATHPETRRYRSPWKPRTAWSRWKAPRRSSARSTSRGRCRACARSRRASSRFRRFHPSWRESGEGTPPSPPPAAAPPLAQRSRVGEGVAAAGPSVASAILTSTVRLARSRMISILTVLRPRTPRPALHRW